MITELSRFTVKKGKEEKALEWMTFLNTHMSDTLLTLKGEKMYVENIFSEVRDDHMYLYWFTFQKEGGQNVEESTSWIDKKTPGVLGRMPGHDSGRSWRRPESASQPGRA